MIALCLLCGCFVRGCCYRVACVAVAFCVCLRVLLHSCLLVVSLGSVFVYVCCMLCGFVSFCLRFVALSLPCVCLLFTCLLVDSLLAYMMVCLRFLLFAWCGRFDCLLFVVSLIVCYLLVAFSVLTGSLAFAFCLFCTCVLVALYLRCVYCVVDL